MTLPPPLPEPWESRLLFPMRFSAVTTGFVRVVGALPFLLWIWFCIKLLIRSDWKIQYVWASVLSLFILLVLAVLMSRLAAVSATQTGLTAKVWGRRYDIPYWSISKVSCRQVGRMFILFHPLVTVDFVGQGNKRQCIRFLARFTDGWVNGVHPDVQVLADQASLLVQSLSTVTGRLVAHGTYSLRLVSRAAIVYEILLIENGREVSLGSGVSRAGSGKHIHQMLFQVYKDEGAESYFASEFNSRRNHSIPLPQFKRLILDRKDSGRCYLMEPGTHVVYCVYCYRAGAISVPAPRETIRELSKLRELTRQHNLSCLAVTVE